MPDIIEVIDALASTSTAYTLAVGQTGRGNLDTGDHDYWRVSLVAGQTYSFAMVGTGMFNVRDTLLRLYSSDGTTLVTSDDDNLEGQNSSFTYTATTTGTYYLDAAAYSSADWGQYGVSVTAGSRNRFDTEMGAGVIDTDLSWSASPGTAATITYGFRDTYSGTQTNFSHVSSTQMSAVASILQTYSELAKLTFSPVNAGGYTNNATMLFSNYSANDGAGAYAYYPGSTASTASAGDVWMNLGSVSTTSLPTGGYSHFAIMHEVGHALGLSHPGVYNAGVGVTITYANNAQFAQDTHQYSIMSYFDESYTTGSYGSYPDTPMLFDIFAIQNIYGANYATRSGNTIYGFNSNAGGVYDFTSNAVPALCIWDGGGTDTLDVSGYGSNQVVNLTDAAFSNVGGYTGNVSIAYGAQIENATGGSGADSITGNAVANVLTGNGGNDTLDGGVGNDTLTGGAGTDALYGGAGNDVLYGDQSETIDGGDGSDVFYNSAALFRGYNLAARNVEIMIASENGNAVNVVRNANGTIDEATYDTANTQSYYFYANHYTSSWQLNLQQFIDDNGIQRNIGYDLTNTEAFQYYQNTYDTQNRLLSQQIRDDNGQERVVGYDVSNGQAYTSYVNTYDAQARLILQQILDDNGNNRVLGYDVDNHYSWAYYQNTFNPAGTMIGSFVQPDGTIGTADEIDGAKALSSDGELAVFHAAISSFSGTSDATQQLFLF